LFTYTFESNGSFIFEFSDKDGNKGTVTATVTNIDKTAPVITINPYTTSPTNEDITVTATTNEGTLNAASHTFTENGSFEFVATDAAGNVTKKTVTITNIDKTAPVITINPYTTSPTNADITVTATTNEGTLNAASHTFTENGSFEFVATDAAGNVTKQIVTITNIDKAAPVVSGVVNNAFYNTNKIITFNEGTGTLNGIAFTSGGSAAQEGSNTLTVTDAAGNITTIQFTIDKTKPVVTAKDTANKTVANNSTVYGDVVVSYSDVNIKTITVKKGTAVIAYPSNGKFTTDGTYTITVTDKAGNTASISFTINKTKPVITAKTSSGSVLNNASVNKSVTVTVNGYNVIKTVTKDGASYIYPSNGIFTASGKYVITAKTGVNISTFTFIIDTVKPAISSQSVTNNGFTKSNVTIVIKDTNLSTKTVTKNGAKIIYPSNSIFTAEGKYIITVKDKAGNITIFTFTIDKTAPKIIVKNSSGTTIANNGSASRSASITVTETNISTKKITKNGSTISWPSTNRVTSKGTYIITVTDKAGNKSTFSFRVV
jgi:hypothetical protein